MVPTTPNQSGNAVQTPSFQSHEVLKKVLLGIIAVLILILIPSIIYLVRNFVKPIPPKELLCAQDAKTCPDGTTVVRVPPYCSFSPCPTTPTPDDETSNWKTYQGEVAFQYPANWIEEKKQTSDTSTDQVFVSPEGGYRLSFRVSQNYNNLTKKPFSTLEDITVNAPYLKEFITVTIDSQAAGKVKGYQADNEGNGAWTYNMFTFSKDKKSIYTLYLFRSNKNIEEDKEGEQIFDQTISTFKFLDPSVEGKRCGYLPVPGSGDDAGCPNGYTCQGVNPGNDAGGVCIKVQQ